VLQTLNEICKVHPMQEETAESSPRKDHRMPVLLIQNIITVRYRLQVGQHRQRCAWS